MRKDRALWVALAMLVLAYGAYDLRQHGNLGLAWFPGCMFKKLTGLHCPGCGMTRAAYATLHGDLFRAFRMNPVGMILLPLALFGISFEVMAWIRGKPPVFRLEVGPRISWTIACVVIGFWILRNIPAWPFSLLAPI